MIDILKAILSFIESRLQGWMIAFKIGYSSGVERQKTLEEKRKSIHEKNKEDVTRELGGMSKSDLLKWVRERKRR